MYGSRSSVSNSLTHVSQVLKCDRYDVREIDHAHIVNNNREDNLYHCQCYTRFIDNENMITCMYRNTKCTLTIWDTLIQVSRLT